MASILSRGDELNSSYEKNVYDNHWYIVYQACRLCNYNVCFKIKILIHLFGKKNLFIISFAQG